MAKTSSKIKKVPWARKADFEQGNQISDMMSMLRKHQISPPEELKTELEQTAQYYFWDEWRAYPDDPQEREYTAAEARDFLKLLEGRCEDLTEALRGVSPEIWMLLQRNAGLDYETFEDIQEKVSRMKSAATHVRATVEGWKSKRHGDPVNRIISILIKVYESSGKRPGLSRTKEQRPSGPCYHFLKDCIEALGYDSHRQNEDPEEALFDRFNRLIKLHNSSSEPTDS